MQQPIMLRRGAMAALLATGLAFAVPAWAQPAGDAAPLRIGVYDSRAVAVAYAGSAVMARRLQELKSRHQQALQAGDSALAARLQSEGQAWQA
ncbi:MAG: hypothetical protein KA141_13980, partial [Rubrivivax sp.]|nr:hypothetical protein [Rubrivivax sp.]